MTSTSGFKQKSLISRLTHTIINSKHSFVVFETTELSYSPQHGCMDENTVIEVELDDDALCFLDKHRNVESNKL